MIQKIVDDICISIDSSSYLRCAIFAASVVGVCTFLEE